MFCNYCGQTNPDDGLFCLKCGKQLNQDGERLCTLPSKHVIKIFRESQTYLLNPPINILIDSKKNYSIANGGTLELSVDSGQHSITFSQSLRKKTIKLDITADISIYLRWNRLTGAIEVTVE